MKYVILISHGDFAGGLHSAVAMMTGDREDVLSTSLRAGESVDDFSSKFKALLQPITAQDEIILLCDILGGSPLTTALNDLSEQGLLERTLVMTGMNLPLAVTACVMKDNVDLPMLKDILLSEGQGAIQEFELEVQATSEDDI